MIFLKLGGSAITDKTRESSAREDVIRRVAREVRNAKAAKDSKTAKLLLGHGSGSFGHFAAQKSGFGGQRSALTFINPRVYNACKEKVA